MRPFLDPERSIRDVSRRLMIEERGVSLRLMEELTHGSRVGRDGSGNMSF